MMFFKWFPWKWLVKRAARRAGMIDPFMVMARLKKFAEPSEVDAPIELMRAWSVFQARGVVNTRAIQHNLDWVWPYWVEKQFNPRDRSFIPRSFSAAHINLTHRDWTAVALPDNDTYALVDPRGLVTPLHDGWSIDAWLVDNQGTSLLPSRARHVSQRLITGDRLAVETIVRDDQRRLVSHVEMERGPEGNPRVQLHWQAHAPAGTHLCISLRPYNPEGIQFIDSVKISGETPGWLVNGDIPVCFNRSPLRYAASDYAAGDVFNRLQEPQAPESVACPVGMATAVACFPLDEHQTCELKAHVALPVQASDKKAGTVTFRPTTTWKELNERTPVLEVPDEKIHYVYTAAVSTLLTLSAGEVFPGSYTYRRFWFRDAALMLNALLTLNHHECCRRAFETSFPRRQTRFGFFQSQEGEWDSNGQVLWLAGRYMKLTGGDLSRKTLKELLKAAEWLQSKRLPNKPGDLNSGLLPSGFSAEHLGPNNYYYWDDFWGVAGLREAAALFNLKENEGWGDTFDEWATDFESCIMTSIQAIPEQRSGGAIPAAANRRMDAGAIGSLAADYPLHLLPPAHPGMMKTVDYLFDNCLLDNGFFHDMIHSGINPYLTLHLAQVLLRANDERYYPLFRRVMELASPTGQWPEAVHPFSGGGCMGDGQHGWAAAEWVLMIRALFLREEGNCLIAAPGLPVEWLSGQHAVSFGPTATAFGSVLIRVTQKDGKPEIGVAGHWRGKAPTVRLGKRLQHHAILKVEALNL